MEFSGRAKNVSVSLGITSSTSINTDVAKIVLSGIYAQHNPILIVFYLKSDHFLYSLIP